MEETDFHESIFLSLVKTIKSLIASVQNLVQHLKDNNPKDYLGRQWIDGQDVCHMLNISKRTLQKYRDNSTIPYSKICGKIFYRARDIEDILKGNYITTTNLNDTNN